MKLKQIDYESFIISVYIDVNCINARQNDLYLNKLEKLFEEGKILIEKTDTLDTELKKGNGYQKGLKKSFNYVESYGAGVWGHSRWGFAKWPTIEDTKKLDTILEILWGKSRLLCSSNELRDAMHIATASDYGGTFFVTNEKNLISKAKEIEEKFTLKIRNPKDCLEEIKKVYNQIR